VPCRLTYLLSLKYWRSYRYLPFPEWQILQAFARQNGNLNATEQYLFSNGGFEDAFWKPWGLLEIAEQIQVEIRYTAPIIVGEYLFSSSVYGAAVQLADGILQYDSSPSTKWDVELSIEVIPAALDALKCTVVLDAELVSGLPSTVSVSPRDTYGNEIRSFGLAFVATATRRENFAIAGIAGGAAFSFDSTYNTVLETYSVELTLPVLGPYSVTVTYDNQALPPTLFPAVRSVICSLGTNPNAAGTLCLCNVGFARQAGVCARCALGSRPSEDREVGCTSCLFEPGTVSIDGLACDACPSGFRPNPGADACVPCPVNQYFELVSQECKACRAGTELVLGQGVPCFDCPAGRAGTDGTCTLCSDGEQPTVTKQLCQTCPVGSAGTLGLCAQCQPGTYQKADQTQCLECEPGKYRAWEDRTDCLECDDGMTSDMASSTLADCRCPRGYYDLFDATARVGTVNAGTYSPTKVMDEKPQPLGLKFWLNEITNNSLSRSEPSWETNDGRGKIEPIYGNPIWCFPDGRTALPNTIDMNVEAMNAIRNGKRCVPCPGCLDCHFDGYRGIPFIKAGYTFFNEDLQDDYDIPGRHATAAPLEDGTILSVAPMGKPAGNGHFFEFIDPQTGQVIDGQSALVSTAYENKERNVLGCPYGGKWVVDPITGVTTGFKGGCHAELEYRNISATIERCATGYTGVLCAECASGYGMKDKGCEFCPSTAEIFGSFGGVGFGGLVFLFIGLPRLRKNATIKDMMDVVRRILPSLVGDIQIFVGVCKFLWTPPLIRCTYVFLTMCARADRSNLCCHGHHAERHVSTNG
jgi:hypothetical protein